MMSSAWGCFGSYNLCLFMASPYLGGTLATELSLLLNSHFHSDSLFNEANDEGWEGLVSISIHRKAGGYPVLNGAVMTQLILSHIT